MYRKNTNSLFGAGVFGDGLGSLRDGVLGQFTGEKKSDGGLDLATGDGGSLVVVSQFGSFTGNSLEDVVDEAVHDAHGFAGDTSVGVHLLQHFVDVDAVCFSPPPPFLLVTRGPLGLSLGDGFFGSFGCCFGWHCEQ